MKNIGSKFVNLLLALGSFYPSHLENNTNLNQTAPARKRDINPRELDSTSRPPLPLLNLKDASIQAVGSSLVETPEQVEAEEMESVTSFPEPVIFISGDPPRDNNFHAMEKHFCKDGNNLFGGYFNIHDQAKYEKDFKEKLKAHQEEHHRTPGFIFAIKFSGYGSLEERSREIDQLVQCVQRLLHVKKVQAVGECMGGAALREYVRQGGRGIDRVIQLGTPNQGMWGIAETGAFVAGMKETLGLPIASLGAFPINRNSHKVLKDAKTNFSIGEWHHNPVLHALNTPENLLREREALELLVVIGDKGYSFLQEKLGKGIPLSPLGGDTVVPFASVALRYATNIFKETQESKNGHGVSNPHKWLKSSKDVLSLLAQILSKQPISLKQSGGFKLAPVNKIKGRIHSRPAEALAVACAMAGYLLGGAVVALALMNKFFGWPNGEKWPKKQFLGAITFEKN